MQNKKNVTSPRGKTRHASTRPRPMSRSGSWIYSTTRPRHQLSVGRRSRPKNMLSALGCPSASACPRLSRSELSVGHPSHHSYLLLGRPIYNEEPNTEKLQFYPKNYKGKYFMIVARVFLEKIMMQFPGH